MSKRAGKGSKPKSPPLKTAEPPPRRVQWSAALVVAVMAWGLYWPSWRHGFVLDDSWVVWKNAWTQQGLSALPQVVSHSLYFGAVPQNSDLYRPVAGIYFVLLGAIGGLQPLGYHLANIALYGVVSAVLFLFFTQIMPRSTALSFVATLLFVAHPIHTEVVNNIKSADEMLCLLFVLTSGIAWLAYNDTSRNTWRWFSVAAFLLAVFTKETAVALGVVPPALWYFFRKRSVRDSLASVWPFLAVAATYVATRWAVFSREPLTNTVTINNNALVAATDGASRLASALVYQAKYLQMLIWPWPLSSDYTYEALPLHSIGDPIAWLAILLGAALIAMVILGFRQRHRIAFAGLWYLASIVIVSNILFLISTNFGERLLFIPSVAVCLVGAIVLFKLTRTAENQSILELARTPLIVVPVILLLAVEVTGVIKRTPDWRDEFSLFSADIVKYPNSARLNAYLGNMYYFAGDKLVGAQQDPGTAKADFEKAVQYLSRGMAIRNTYSEYNAVLGMAQYQLGMCKDAIPQLQQTITFSAYRHIGLSMIASCYEQLEMAPQALDVYRTMDAEGIADPHGWFVLGNDAAAQGHDDASIAWFQKVVAATPSNAAAYSNIAAAQFREHHYSDSLASVNQCIAISQTLAQCYVIGANDLMQLGRRDEALAYMAKAQAIK